MVSVELMKHKGGSKEEIAGLGIASESEGLKGLAAGIFHHAALFLWEQRAMAFANRSMRLREEVGDLEGMIWPALLAHISKEEGELETSKMHLKKRLDIIPDSETLEKMEALADLAHIHTIGVEDAQNL